MMPASAPAVAPGASTGMLASFHLAAQKHGFSLDPAQLHALQTFDRLFQDLQMHGHGARGWFRFLARRRPLRGIYLWGAVGRGKSFLMDEFFRIAPVRNKHRVHFHRFMQRVHHDLRDLQGQADPMGRVADRVARESTLLCLDEFHITDIGDAMVMRHLLQGLFDAGVALVTTSNHHPDRLYEHGLQRAQFVPAIELLKAHLEVVELQGEQDYRLRALERSGVYHCPLADKAERALEEGFLAVAGERGEVGVEIEVEGRLLVSRRIAPGVIWFGFEQLCEGPRGTHDYIELSKRYHTVLVSSVPQFGPEQGDSMRRFTWLVDEFYDRQVKLMLSAEVPVERLYERVATTTDTDRTRSRLIEMQSRRYLSLPHLA